MPFANKLSLFLKAVCGLHFKSLFKVYVTPKTGITFDDWLISCLMLLMVADGADYGHPIISVFSGDLPYHHYLCNYGFFAATFFLKLVRDRWSFIAYTYRNVLFVCLILSFYEEGIAGHNMSFFTPKHDIIRAFVSMLSHSI